MKKHTFIDCSKFIFTTVFLFFVFQCTQENDNTDEGSFDIFLVTDSGLNILEFDTTDIEDIVLPEKPVASICDIDTYKILQSESGLSLSHSIIFKENMKEKFGDSNCYFVLVVNGIRMYKGEYWANFMNTMSQNVLIYAYRENEFHIMTVGDGVSQINDSRIINTLVDHNVTVIYEKIGT